MNKAIVVINYNQGILKEQVDILDERYEVWEVVCFSERHQNYETQIKVAHELSFGDRDIIFVSSMPALLKMVVEQMKDCVEADCYVFHNDDRKLVSIGGGQVMSVESDVGWKLV